MHVHIIGICGTFMGGVAALARAAGHHVTGSDAAAWPPMSDQLRALGIDLYAGYAAANLEPEPDCVVVGNALSRGNPEVEAVLDRGLPYTSGPQWLAEHVLAGRWVLAVAGTHGKTTTASMLAWILEDAGLSPGFLIGGVPGNFEGSARAGVSPFFVVEADEYDTAFFDKRSKFVHYRPRTLVLNNLEYDHADIFPDLPAIQRQFHHLVRTVPASGQILASTEASLDETLAMGCWSETVRFGGGDWDVTAVDDDWRHFTVLHDGQPCADVHWSQGGRHNALNGLAAMLAARHAGVTPEMAGAALSRFAGVRRRMELLHEDGGRRFFDDFAHHPTAVTATLAAVRQARPGVPLIAVLEPRSNTMRMGVHRAQLREALGAADRVLVLVPADMGWDVQELIAGHPHASAHTDAADAHRHLCADLPAEAEVVLMSNGDLGGLRELITAS